MKYAAIADWADEKEYPVTFMCEQLGVVRQGYYRWRSAGPCERERTDAELTEQILEIHSELDGHPGVRRVWAELVTRGVRVAPKRIWRLMRAAGLRGRHPRAWRKTTLAGQRSVDAPDLIGRERVHQHEVGEHLEVIAEGMPRGALYQRVVPGQAEHLTEVLEGHPATPWHDVKGAATRDGRQRVANSGRERPHDQVPQPEEPRQQHQRRAVPSGAGTA